MICAVCLVMTLRCMYALMYVLVLLIYVTDNLSCSSLSFREAYSIYKTTTTDY